MRRFFIDKIEKKGGTCLIKGPEARHMVRVLRMGTGDRFILMDGQGDHYRAIIESINLREISVHLEAKLPPQPPSPVRIILGQVVLKPKAMDMLIQKCSELGVDRVVPLFSQRTVSGLAEANPENKARHWLEISRSAAKQSGRQRPAEIGQPVMLEGFLREHEREEAFKIILHEVEKARGLKDLIRNTSPLEEVVGLVGPEGGFTDREVDFARASGFIPVSLGYRILRAETAGITLTALMQYEWGDLGAPGP